MRVHITLTDARGATFEGTAELVRGTKSVKAPKTSAKTGTTTRPTKNLSFSLNSRAFMNKHAKSLSGSRKFTLLLAHLAHGKIGEDISGEQIVSTWNKMKSVMGGAYNTAHATRAKEEGWIDSPKRGFYALSDSWKEVTSDE